MKAKVVSDESAALSTIVVSKAALKERVAALTKRVNVLVAPLANSKLKIKNSKLHQRAYVRVANPVSGARNPGFDVTPAELITGIITPAGIFKPKELWTRRRELGFGG